MGNPGSSLASLTHPFHPTAKYQFSDGAIECVAYEGASDTECAKWLGTEVSARVFDTEVSTSFVEDIEALKLEGFDTTSLQAYIDEPYPDATLGDIGEGIADLFLMEHISATLPTNRRRDLRTPKGSLPGADIVGYVPASTNGVQFLFGEIKASAQKSYPPGVMTGTDGMPAQIERLATVTSIRRQLFHYLKSRSTDAQGKQRFKAALKSLTLDKYSLVGVLVRDTVPNVNDVKSAAAALKLKLKGRGVALYVLHMATPSTSWSTHCKPA